MNKPVFDGYSSFIGGMDTSRSPSLIAKNQYVFSVNMEIPKAKEGIRTRRGFRCIKLSFGTNKEEDIFKGGNVQGIGYYYNSFINKLIIVVSISGYIIELIPTTNEIYKVVFTPYRNNPNNKHCYFTNVPEGLIINDGESDPIYLFSSKRGRASSNLQIGPSVGGVYVQNRFWYIHPDRKVVIGSTIKDSLSLEEAYLDNIYGFSVPDETENIVAIGKQRTISRDATGGNLAFATNRSNYAVDVRGARTAWGLVNGSVGSVDNVVNEVGAVSAFSYASANSNIYFRNLQFGLMSTKSSQYQFVNSDNFSPVSIESSAFFDNDTPELLDSCYTIFHKTRLFTTVGPQIKDGFVYWNGLLVMSPDIYFATKDRAEINRLESIYTGIRPICLISARDNYNEHLFIMSYDKDCINRLYVFDERIDYDVDNNGNNVEIESKLLTRLFNFDSASIQKVSDKQFYGFSSTRNVDVNIYTRRSDTSEFEEIWSYKHCLEKCNQLVPLDKTINANSNIAFADNNNRFFQKQDLLKFKGPITLTKLIRVSIEEPIDFSVPKLGLCTKQERIRSRPEKLYTYSISKEECSVENETLFNIEYVEQSFKLVTRSQRINWSLLVKGEKGAKGSDGAKGEKGDTGATGPAGSNGSQIYYYDSLIGGGSTALDGFVTAGQSVPFVITILIGSELQDWLLVADTYAEDPSNGIVQPDDYNPITNIKTWLRIR